MTLQRSHVIAWRRFLSARTCCACLSAAVISSSCGGSPTSPATTPVSTSLVISGTSVITDVGQTSQLIATFTIGTGTPQIVTTTATWQSSNSAVATVTPGGLVTAMALGTATISATYQATVASQPITVGASKGQIASCGTYSGAGPFTVATDIKSAAINCLTFSGTISGTLDCKGHDVSSITLSGVMGFSIQNCTMSAGLNMTLRVLNSRNVTVDASQVTGSLYVSATQTSIFRGSTFRWPLLPANPSGAFESSEVYFIGGAGNQVLQSTIDGGWDGNFATYQKQGCDDGILIQNEANSIIQGNHILNVFDAGVESGVSPVPITTTITGNTFSHNGYTAIGGYYVQGWQNSTFSDNTVTNTPNVMTFTSPSSQPGVTSMTFVNNEITNNRLQGFVPWPSGVLAPALLIDYVSGGLPHTVTGNLIQGNNLGTNSRAPILLPADGFIDGGGNICQQGGTLACNGMFATTMELPSIVQLRAPERVRSFPAHTRRVRTAYPWLLNKELGIKGPLDRNP